MSASNGDATISQISPDVLKMNFMKRTTVKLERQKRAQEQQQARQQIAAGKLEVLPPRHYPTVEHIDDDPNITLGGMMTEWRYTVLQDNLRFGRFSYNGQNPEVEKWMLFHERRRLGIADEEEEAQQQQDDDEREEGELTDDGEDSETIEMNPKRRRGENVHGNAETVPEHLQRSRMGYQGGMEETTKKQKGTMAMNGKARMEEREPPKWKRGMRGGKNRGWGKRNHRN